MKRLLLITALLCTSLFIKAQDYDPYSGEMLEPEQITCSICNKLLKEITVQKENLDLAYERQNKTYMNIHTTHLKLFGSMCMIHFMRCDKPHILTPLQAWIIKMQYFREVAQFEQSTDEIEYDTEYMKKIDSYIKKGK